MCNWYDNEQIIEKWYLLTRRWTCIMWKLHFRYETFRQWTNDQLSMTYYTKNNKLARIGKQSGNEVKCKGRNLNTSKWILTFRVKSFGVSQIFGTMIQIGSFFKFSKSSWRVVQYNGVTFSKQGSITIVMAI
jgi:hypothetical protein